MVIYSNIKVIPMRACYRGSQFKTRLMKCLRLLLRVVRTDPAPHFSLGTSLSQCAHFERRLYGLPTFCANSFPPTFHRRDRAVCAFATHVGGRWSCMDRPVF